MLKGLLATVGLGLAGYVAYEAYSTKGIQTQDNEGFLNSLVGVVEGGFMKVGSKIISNNVNANLTPSIRLIAFLKGYEKFRSMPYFATAAERKAGKKTIGYGHLILPHENFDSGINEAQANALFLKDLNKHIQQIYEQVTVPLSQSQFDALCSLMFNLGPYALSSYKKFKAALNSGNYDEAANAFMWFTKQDGVVVEGLYLRRTSEFKMFKFGTYERL